MKKFSNYIQEKQVDDNVDIVKHYVDAILISEDNKILILRRANYMKKFGGYWGFVGGSIEEKDKDHKDAIIREIKEETGIELTYNETLKMSMLDKIEHLRKDDSTESDTEYWVVKLETTPEIKISREHSKYEWVNDEILSTKNYKFIPGLFQIIQKCFNEIINVS